MTWITRNIAGGNFFSWKPALDLGINHGFGDRGLTYSSEEKDIFCQTLGQALKVKSISQATQVHGVGVFNVSKESQIQEADTLMGDLSDTPNAGIFIKTADCVPLIGIGEAQITLIHAGWRGLAGGAIQSALKLVPGLKTVLVGPAAGKCCYDVGREVIQEIGSEAAYEERHGRIFLSTSRTAENIVRKYFTKVELHSVELCTICDSKYNSYRRDKNNLRNITFATVFSELKA